MFSTKSQFTKDDHRVCIASQMGEVNPVRVVKRQKGMTHGVMIWKAMEYDFESPLVVSRDTDGTALCQIHLAYMCPTSPEIIPWHSLLTNQSVINVTTDWI